MVKSKTIITLSAIKLVGIATRTSNTLEMNPATAKIGATMGRFWGSGIQAQISGRKNPGRVFAVYTNYDSSEGGAYTYFVGEEVNDFEHIHHGFETLMIPVQTYVKFTSEPGTMPDVCLDLWQKIWQMKADDLGGERAYVGDFEVYDGCSHDPNDAVLDIYIGIRK
jgi:predicted transcriptional regulator YdeE